jgi:hypothetical protein
MGGNYMNATIYLKVELPGWGDIIQVNESPAALAARMKAANLAGNSTIRASYQDYPLVIPIDMIGLIRGRNSRIGEE